VQAGEQALPDTAATVTRNVDADYMLAEVPAELLDHVNCIPGNADALASSRSLALPGVPAVSSLLCLTKYVEMCQSLPLHCSASHC
jgi:hypothetical protein